MYGTCHSTLNLELEPLDKSERIQSDEQTESTDLQPWCKLWELQNLRTFHYVVPFHEQFFFKNKKRLLSRIKTEKKRTD